MKNRAGFRTLRVIVLLLRLLSPQFPLPTLYLDQEVECRSQHAVYPHATKSGHVQKEERPRVRWLFVSAATTPECRKILRTHTRRPEQQGDVVVHVTILRFSKLTQTLTARLPLEADIFRDFEVKSFLFWLTDADFGRLVWRETRCGCSAPKVGRQDWSMS